MLRAVTLLYLENINGSVFRSRRDVFKVFSVSAHTSSTEKTQVKTVLMSPRGADTTSSCNASVAPRSNVTPPTPLNSSSVTPPPPPPSSSPPPSKFTSAWTVAAAFAVTASLGGMYFLKKYDQLKDEDIIVPTPEPKVQKAPLIPESASELPSKVDFLLVGGGTASFAALRALRAAQPTATILLAGDERAPPYMRPPLSKEVWREASLSKTDATSLSFKQWSGRRRWLVYEPRAFYQPPATAPALGWTVTELDVEARTATLQAGDQKHTVKYDQCLLAPGSSPRRLSCTSKAAAAGRALVLRAASDAALLAEKLDSAPGSRLLVIGGGLLGSEVSAAISASGRAQVSLSCRSSAPLSSRLPQYLTADVAATLNELGVKLYTNAEPVDSTINDDGSVDVKFEDGRVVTADIVLECVGAEPRSKLAEEAGLEIDPNNGGIVVDAELRARSGVYAAGDVASFYNVRGRRRLLADHHDHAVRSGRRAAENMAADHAHTDHTRADHGADHSSHVRAPRTTIYDYQPMFWSDLGPDLGYEAVGIIDSKLRTVGIFSEEFVNETTKRAISAQVSEHSEETQEKRDVNAAPTRKYERGVVFYLEGKKVVGVLLWNLFNRVTLASQVIAQGEFDDLMEVAKLFSPHEEQ